MTLKRYGHFEEKLAGGLKNLEKLAKLEKFGRFSPKHLKVLKLGL